MLGADGEESAEVYDYDGQALARDVAIDITASAPQPAQRRLRGGKRNKPTLSCAACVERKSKCNRGRPICLAW